MSTGKSPTGKTRRSTEHREEPDVVAQRQHALKHVHDVLKATPLEKVLVEKMEKLHRCLRRPLMRFMSSSGGLQLLRGPSRWNSLWHLFVFSSFTSLYFFTPCRLHRSRPILLEHDASIGDALKARHAVRGSAGSCGVVLSRSIPLTQLTRSPSPAVAGEAPYPVCAYGDLPHARRGVGRTRRECAPHHSGVPPAYNGFRLHQTHLCLFDTSAAALRLPQSSWFELPSAS